MNTAQLHKAILLNVVERFRLGHKQSTSRHSLLIDFKGHPTTQAISNLTTHTLINPKSPGVPTNLEEYYPRAAAFHFCGNNRLRDEARDATTTVLRMLSHMFEDSRNRTGFSFDDLKRYVEKIEPQLIADDEWLKLGLFLAKDFNVVQPMAMSSDNNEVIRFSVNESAVTMVDPDTEWDRVMALYSPVVGPLLGDGPQDKTPAALPAKARWEQVRRLGGGGQSDVFLVRAPERVKERERCIAFLNSSSSPRTGTHEALTEHSRQFAEILSAYGRSDLPSELGAMKVFKIREEGREQQALERLRQEFQILEQNRAGLPKLLDANLEERWLVTEYFPGRTLRDHPHQFRGNAPFALRAIRSLVQTVVSLHADGYVHRDIKPANVFVRNPEELVLGDLGIVFIPNPEERVTDTEERVGPRDYMPLWAYLGRRPHTVDPRVDVYMLGKLLWSMIDGRLYLPGEYYNRPEFDLTQTFRGNPDMFLINAIFKRCIVDDPKQCLSAGDLLVAVDTTLHIMKMGGQILTPDVPRPCHICGNGLYQPKHFGPDDTPMLRFWMSGSSADVKAVRVQVFSCNNCGHIQLFVA